MSRLVGERPGGATVLTLHQGGVDSRPSGVVWTERTKEAADALAALVEVMDYDDRLLRACDILAIALRGRLIGRPVA